MLLREQDRQLNLFYTCPGRGMHYSTKVVHDLQNFLPVFPISCYVKIPLKISKWKNFAEIIIYYLKYYKNRNYYFLFSTAGGAHKIFCGKFFN